MLSKHDIISQYRRTKLGPMWVVLSAALSLGIMSMVWSVIFKLAWQTYLPYMIVGIVIWNWIVDHITSASNIYTQTFASWLKTTPHPPVLYNFRYTGSRLFFYLHYIPLVLSILLITGTIPSFPQVLLIIPAMLVILLNGFSATIIWGFANARFRDVGLLVQALMTPMMLLSPVLWRPNMLGSYAWLVNFNPFAHFIDILRSPIIGVPTPEYAWIIAMGITAAHVSLAMAIYYRYRNYLVLWT